LSDSCELEVNSPFKAHLIKELYRDRSDLKLASPRARYPFWDKEWEDQFPLDSDNCSLCLKFQEKIVGHAAIITSAEDIYICYVIIDEKYRKQGLGKKMIQLIEEFCRLNYPHKELFLNVSKDNVIAIKLYEDLGYSSYDDSDDKYRMVKKLKR
jgi:ribosomal protein S18 acetylase RimI-like enzyme